MRLGTPEFQRNVSFLENTAKMMSDWSLKKYPASSEFSSLKWHYGVREAYICNHGNNSPWITDDEQEPKLGNLVLMHC